MATEQKLDEVRTNHAKNRRMQRPRSRKNLRVLVEKTKLPLKIKIDSV